MITSCRTEAVRHTHSIRAAENLVRASFPDDLGDLGNDYTKKIANLQKEFRAVANFARRKYGSLRFDLDRWTVEVASNQRPFSLDEEAEFKESLFAWVAFVHALWEKSETYRQKGVLVLKPVPFSVLLDLKGAAVKTLKDWQSPRQPASEKDVEAILEMGKPGLEYSEDLLSLARQVIQNGPGDTLPDEEWADGIAKQLTAADD